LRFPQREDHYQGKSREEEKGGATVYNQGGRHLGKKKKRAGPNLNNLMYYEVKRALRAGGQPEREERRSAKKKKLDKGYKSGKSIKGGRKRLLYRRNQRKVTDRETGWHKNLIRKPPHPNKKITRVSTQGKSPRRLEPH